MKKPLCSFVLSTMATRFFTSRVLVESNLPPTDSFIRTEPRPGGKSGGIAESSQTDRIMVPG